MSKAFGNGINLLKTQLQNALIHIIAGDATTPSDSQFWYNSSTFKFRGRANGVNVTFVNDGGDLTAGSVAIAALAVDPRARGSHTGTQLAATISDFDTQVRTSRLDQLAVAGANVAMNTFKITGLGLPITGSDAANKSYVDGAITGLSWKSAVRLASTANGTLATAFANASVVDGVTLVTGDRLLLKNQTAGGENGIYIVQSTGAPVRPTDMDTGVEFLGAAVMVMEGTGNANTQWVQTIDGTITIGTTSTVWTQFGGAASYTAGNGLTVTANDFNVGQGSGIIVGADTVSIDPAVVVRKFALTIGNGALTVIPVAHNLGSKDVTYSIRQVSDDAFIDTDVVATDTNTLTLTFAVAPTASQYRVTVQV